MAGISDGSAECACARVGFHMNARGRRTQEQDVRIWVKRKERVSNMEEFIKNITDQIRCVRARDAVAKELSDHIRDQAESYEEAGTEHEEAVRRAIREMGDPVQIGVELDRIHRPQIDFRMIAMVFVFSLGGLILQYFGGGYTHLPNVNVAPMFVGLFGRQCLILLLAFAVMVGVYFLDYTFIGRYGIWIYVGMTILFFTGTLVLSRVNGRIPVMFMLTYLYIPAYVGVLYQLRGRGYAAVVQSIVLQFITVAFVYVFTNLLSGAGVIYLIQTILLILAVGSCRYLGNAGPSAPAVGGLSGGKSGSLKLQDVQALCVAEARGGPDGNGIYLYVASGGTVAGQMDRSLQEHTLHCR